jgi:fucose permease
MTSKEKNPLPYIIAAACFIVLFVLMKAQDVRTESAQTTSKESVQKRKVANSTKN